MKKIFFLTLVLVLSLVAPSYALNYLKQSTAAVVNFGPFVDKTDGVTYETGLAGTGANQLEHTSSGILISKNGGTLAARHATATASTYDAYGIYKVTLDTTDTGTLGRLMVVFGNNDALPVWAEYIVVRADVFDTMCSTDYLQVDVIQLDSAALGTHASGMIPADMRDILGTAVSAPATAGILDVNLKNIANAVVSTSTAQLGVNLVNIAGSAVSTSTAQLGVNAVQIGAAVPGSATVGTVTNLTNAPTNGDLTATMKTSVTTAATSSTPALSAAGVTAIWDKDISAYTGAKAGTYLKGIYDKLPAGTIGTSTYAGGAVASVTGSVGSISGVTFPTNFSALSISATTGLVDITQTAADKVWGTTARLLTAGTNIVLAKGVGITGFNDITAQNVWEYATRVLTAGTNIVLAKGTGITGFNDITAQNVWDVLTSALTTLNSVGKLLVDNINATIGSRSSHSAADVATAILVTPANKIASATGGKVTVGTNDDKTGYTVSTVSDKTGYSLTQAFPTNFSSLAITSGGAVTAGTISDKTGYSLSQTFPANFADLVISPTTGLVSVDKTGYALSSAYDAAKNAASQSSVNTIDGIVDDIKAVTLKIDSAMELDGSIYRFTQNALEQAPGGVGSGDWTANEKTEIKTILGVTGTGTPTETPTAGSIKKVQRDMPTPYSNGP